MNLQDILTKLFEKHKTLINEKVMHREPALAEGGFMYQYACLDTLAEITEQAGFPDLAKDIDYAVIAADVRRKQRGLHKCTCRRTDLFDNQKKAT